MMATQQPVTGIPAPPNENPQERKPPRSRGHALMVLTLLVSVYAAVASSIALIRHESPPVPTSAPQQTAPTGSAAPSPTDISQAKTVACANWDTASKAMVKARRAFIEAPPNWDDPVNASALAQAQAGILIQIEYLRHNVPAATPPELSRAITDYNTASSDLAALDGQHQSAAVANAAADRTGALATKIHEICGMN